MNAPDQNGRKGSEAARFAAAFAGLKEALSSEAHFRFECVFAVIALLLCAALRVDFAGWVAVLCFCALVLSLELVNTALESAVDIATQEIHPLAKRAKDVAAAAVLVASATALICGIAIYARAFGRLIGWW